MIKLLTIATLVAATLGTGCEKKERTEADQPVTAPKTTEEMQPPGTAPGTAPDTTAPATPPPTAPTDEKTPEAMALPTECTEYKATIEKIRTCDKLPQATRDALVQAYEQASSGWSTATPETRASLASSCKSAHEAIKQSAAACP